MLLRRIGGTFDTVVGRSAPLYESRGVGRVWWVPSREAYPGTGLGFGLHLIPTLGGNYTRLFPALIKDKHLQRAIQT